MKVDGGLLTLAVVRGGQFTTSPSQLHYQSQRQKTAIVLPIREYQRLLEDLHDLGMVAERHDEYPVSLAEMKKRLNDHAKI